MIYNIDGDYMKKTLAPIVFLACFAILSFLILTKANGKLLSNEEAIKLGEEKYLKFLWMIDGAFNSERMGEDFIVNGNSLAKDDKIFTCKFKKKDSNECIGNNFPEEFANLFSKNITYGDVYSDGAMDYKLSYVDEEYIFNIMDGCGFNRMDNRHEISVVEVKDDSIIYKVLFRNKETNIMNKRDFILSLEDNEWKISKAFYYDLCGTKYYIG